MENAHATTVEALEARSRLIRTPVAYTRGWLEWRIWGEGPPLVLIHGGHGSWTHWIRTIPALSRHFTVVAPDLPGYGSSDPPASGVADPDELARLLGDGLPAVTGDNRFGLAGFSFGGVVAGHLAALIPDRVRRLVLIGAGGLGLPRPPPPALVKWAALPASQQPEAHRANLVSNRFEDQPPFRVQG